jgi:streptogramin lyase
MARRCTLVVVTLVVWTVSASYSASHPGSGIAVDEHGAVYFTDTGRGVWRLGDAGRLTLISKSAMHWMAIDREGRFAEAPEQFSEWFGRLTPQGDRPTLISCSDFPCVIGADGNLYFAKMHGLTIMRRTPDGEESALVTPKDFGFEPDRPVGVNGIACGPDGAIYLVALDQLHQSEASEEHIIYVVAKDGRVRTFAKNFITDKIPESERHHEARPEYCRGMAVDADGNVYVAATGNRCVLKLTPRGEATTVLTCEKPWTPTGVDVREGDVYVLEYDDETPTEGRNWPPRVRKVDRNGNVTTLVMIERD